MARLLRGFNHVVQTAGEVAGARQLAASHNFDLVVSDLGLPDGNGLDLMQYLRQQYGLRGIALSGYGMEEDVRQSKAAGFDEHLLKPLSLEALQRILERAPRESAGIVA